MHSLENPLDLSGKVALITGAGSGFGAGIAKLFVKLGAQVIGLDLNASTVTQIATTVGNGMEGRQADVTNSADLATAVMHTVTTHGKLDIMVNNAGYTHRNTPMLEINEADFDKVMAVNVKSIYLSAIHAIPAMQANGGGVMINIASTAGVRPRAGLTWYNGSKGAVITLTKSMASEVAADNIRINAINPVMGETGMLNELLPGGDSPAARAAVIANIPLGRLSKPLDVANATAFFASDAASFITGTTLEVDGGRCI